MSLEILKVCKLTTDLTDGACRWTAYRSFKIAALELNQGKKTLQANQDNKIMAK